MAIRVTVSSLAGNELCQVEVPGSMRASDLRQRIGHELGLNPYTFKLRLEVFILFMSLYQLYIDFYIIYIHISSHNL